MVLLPAGRPLHRWEGLGLCGRHRGDEKLQLIPFQICDPAGKKADLRHSQSNDIVMVNRMCQLDWAMGCPESWLNIISGSACESVSA